MKSNPKTIAGVIVLVILAVALGVLLSRLFPPRLRQSLPAPGMLLRGTKRTVQRLSAFF